MAFDPDKYLSEKAKAPGGFDPDAYLKQKLGDQDMGSSFDPNDTKERFNRRLKEGITPDGDLLTRLSEIPRTAYNTAREIPAIELKAIKTMLHAANYPGGLARTALAGLSGQATMKDFYNAVAGNAPSNSDYLKKAGVGPGPNVDIDLGRYDVPYIGDVNLAGNISARDVGGFALDVATDPISYAGQMGKMGEGIESVGKMIYRSGVKNLDKEVARYGKDAVSDVLMKERIAGSAETVKNKMTELADKRLAQRNEILANATKAGAETNVPASLADAESYLKFLKSEPDERLAPLIEKMEAEIATLRKSTGQAATPAVYDTSEVLKELPVSRTQPILDTETRKAFIANDPNAHTWYNAPTLSNRGADGKASLYQRAPGVNERGVGIVGEPVINNPVDAVITNKLPVQGTYGRPAPYEVAIDTPREMSGGFDLGPKVLEEAKPYKAAPNPEQMTRMKTNTYSTIGDEGYLEGKSTPLWERLEKLIAGGQRKEVESTVGRTLGGDAEFALKQRNDDLGRLLSSQERAEKDALIAARKHYVSQVDSGMLAAAVEHPSVGWAWVGKTLGRIGQATGPRTYGGLALQDIGQNFGKFNLPQGVGIRTAEDLAADDPSSPWARMRTGR